MQVETQKESREHATMLIVQRNNHSSKAVVVPSRKEEGGTEHEEIQFLPQAQCVLI